MFISTIRAVVIIFSPFVKLHMNFLFLEYFQQYAYIFLTHLFQLCIYTRNSKWTKKTEMMPVFYENIMRKIIQLYGRHFRSCWSLIDVFDYIHHLNKRLPNIWYPNICPKPSRRFFEPVVPHIYNRLPHIG